MRTRTARLLGGDLPEICHQLARVLEPREVADLGNDSNGHDQDDATHGPHSFRDGSHRPRSKQVLDLRGYPLNQLGDVIRKVRKDVNMAHLPAPPAIGDRNRDRSPYSDPVPHTR